MFRRTGKVFSADRAEVMDSAGASFSGDGISGSMGSDISALESSH